MVNKRTHVVNLRPFGYLCRYVCTCGDQSRLFTEREGARWAGQLHADQTGGRLEEERHR